MFLLKEVGEEESQKSFEVRSEKKEDVEWSELKRGFWEFWESEIRNSAQLLLWMVGTQSISEILWKRKKDFQMFCHV